MLTPTLNSSVCGKALRRLTLSNAGCSVSIIQLCLPHYRVPFFRCLTELAPFNLNVVCGPHSFGDSPVTEKYTPGICRIDVHNYFIGRQLAVQAPLPNSVWHDEVLILEFNPRILTNLWLLFLRKTERGSVILWGHGLSTRNQFGILGVQLLRWMANLADAVILYSESGRKDFMRLGLPREKLFVAHNSLDVNLIRHLAASLPNYSRFRILCIGRFIPDKKPLLLLKAFSWCYKQLPETICLTFIGDGPERGKLEAFARQAGISHRIEFTGSIIDEARLAVFFKSALLSVSPGYIGLSAIHSLAYGVPVLVADREPHSPEIEVLVDGRNCKFFAADDPVSLADKLVNLLAQPKKLEEMGTAGLIDVSGKYSLRHMVDVFVQAVDYVRGKQRLFRTNM